MLLGIDTPDANGGGWHSIGFASLDGMHGTLGLCHADGPVVVDFRLPCEGEVLLARGEKLELEERCGSAFLASEPLREKSATGKHLQDPSRPNDNNCLSIKTSEPVSSTHMAISESPFLRIFRVASELRRFGSVGTEEIALSALVSVVRKTKVLAVFACTLGPRIV